MRFSPLLMQFDSGMSISRYLPASGTAGLRAILGQRIEPSAAAAAEDQRQNIPHA